MHSSLFLFFLATFFSHPLHFSSVGEFSRSKSFIIMCKPILLCSLLFDFFLSMQNISSSSVFQVIISSLFFLLSSSSNNNKFIEVLNKFLFRYFSLIILLPSIVTFFSKILNHFGIFPFMFLSCSMQRCFNFKSFLLSSSINCSIC